MSGENAVLGQRFRFYCGDLAGLVNDLHAQLVMVETNESYHCGQIALHLVRCLYELEEASSLSMVLWSLEERLPKLSAGLRHSLKPQWDDGDMADGVLAFCRMLVARAAKTELAVEARLTMAAVAIDRGAMAEAESLYRKLSREIDAVAPELRCDHQLIGAMCLARETGDGQRARHMALEAFGMARRHQWLMLETRALHVLYLLS